MPPKYGEELNSTDDCALAQITLAQMSRTGHTQELSARNAVQCALSRPHLSREFGPDVPLLSLQT